jgi:hypothetical protein
MLKLSVRSATELSIFESEAKRVSLGSSITRSMAYAAFRLAVQEYHQVGTPTHFRAILPQNLYITVAHGIADLYRNVDEDHALDCDVPLDEAIEFTRNAGNTFPTGTKKRTAFHIS